MRLGALVDRLFEALHAEHPPEYPEEVEATMARGLMVPGEVVVSTGVPSDHAGWM